MTSKQKISNDFLEVLFLMRHRVFRHIAIPLPINQFAILAILSDEKSMTFSEIVHKLSIIKQQLSPLLDCLEKDGFVKRFPDTKDHRRIRVKITIKGRRFITAHQNKIKSHLETTLSALSDEGIKEFDNSLQTLIHLFGKISILH